MANRLESLDTRPILESLLTTLGRPLADHDTVRVEGSDPVLSTRFRIGEAAASVLAACGLAASDLWRVRGANAERRAGQEVEVEVPAAAAALLSFVFLRGANVDLTRDAGRPTVALYPARDGRWVHLHGGFPHLRDGLLELLECDDDAAAIGHAVGRWDASTLEEAIAERRLCGAMVRSESEWASHAQGRALADRPVLEIRRIGDADPTPLPEATAGDRPLAGTRVLDLTRVLAGPTCARTLAEHGADVLHVRGPDLPFIEPFVVDTNHGKRSTLLDLKSSEGVAQLGELVDTADVFSQGYRAGRLDLLGLAPEALAERRPGLVCVSINCYGHEGPWRERAGWEQLAQTVCGIAHEQSVDGVPVLLPAAATDYTTGYLGALGVLLALGRRAREGGSWHVRVSLARTGMWLQSLGRTDAKHTPTGVGTELLERYGAECDTEWGRLFHLGPVLRMSETPPRWERPPVPLGSHHPSWVAA